MATGSKRQDDIILKRSIDLAAAGEQYNEMLTDFTSQLPLPIAGQQPSEDPVRAAADDARAKWQDATEAALALALAIANDRATNRR